MPSPQRTQFRLLILGDGSVRTVPLTGHRWIIGRSPDCEIPLRDPTVSRRHLLLERTGDEFRFQDLGGSNPVQLDGKSLRLGALTTGQALTIGLTKLVLEQRDQPSPVVTNAGATVVLSREVVDDELPDSVNRTFTTTAARVLQRIEWTFADLGALGDAADPLLDLALNLTGRQKGWIARLHERGGIETLAALHTAGHTIAPDLPESTLDEARRIARPHLLRTKEDGRERGRLIVPLGKPAGAMLVLEEPGPDAAEGQELLRLAQSLGAVIWHRLQETTERARLRDELDRLRFHGTLAHNALLASNRLQPTREQLRAIASGPDAVLIVGEEGTEREELARYLHAESPQRAAPFLTFDASQVPIARQAVDLLGDGDRHGGALERSAGGVLFVDHASQLATELLPRLTAQLTGTALTDAPRIVLGCVLTEAAKEPPWTKALRERLRMATIAVPPLRCDARDVLALAELFLSELGSGPDDAPRLMTERTKRLLMKHAWPGNVRELRLVIEAAAARAGSQPIAPRHLPTRITQHEAGAAQAPLPTLADVEREHIQEVMQRTGGVRSQAAQILGIAASTLYEKLKKYNIDA